MSYENTSNMVKFIQEPTKVKWYPIGEKPPRSLCNNCPHVSDYRNCFFAAVWDGRSVNPHNTQLPVPKGDRLPCCRIENLHIYKSLLERAGSRAEAQQPRKKGR